LAWVTTVLAACGGGGAADVAGRDDQGPDASDVADVLADAGTEGRGDALDASDAHDAPAVRLFRVTDPADLVGGPFAGGEVGDFVLENSRARFVVRGGVEPAFWGPYGGNVIDADVRRPTGEAGHDLLGELIPVFGMLRTFRPSTFEILDDGSGGSAILRVSGTDAGIPIIDSAVATKPLHLAIVLEYRLEPDRPWLEIRSTVTNPGDAAVTVLTGAVPMWQDRLVKYYDGLALEDDAPAVKSGLPSVQALASDVAYALVAGQDQALSAPINIQGVEALQVAKPTLAPGATDTRTLYLAVAGGDALDLSEATAAVRLAAAPVPVRGSVTGLPVEVALRDVLVVAQDAQGKAVAATVPDREGRFDLGLAPGGPYAFEVRVRELGSSRVEGVTVASEGFEPPALAAPAIAVLEAACHPSDAAGLDLPCRVALQPGPAAALDAPVVSERFAGPGRHRFAVPPGTWTVTFSRGFEYELDRHDVALAAGGEAAVTGSLVRSVDTSGWVATTVHVHSELSMDSDLPLDLRMYSLAAAGMEYIYPTEHDVCADYQPFVDQLGLTAWMKSDVGCEVSPMPGHFNCLGCAPTAAAFAVPFVAYTPAGDVDHVLLAPELWQRMRDTLGATLLQINHPFSTQAFFASLGLRPGDPLGPLVSEKFDLSFDLLELHNSHDDASDLYDETLPTWYRMLNDGIRRTGVGSEDTHSAHDAGTPRTLVMASDQGAEAIEPAAIAAGLKEGRAVSVQGPFPELWVNDLPIGSVTAPVAGEVSIRVRVQAPTWMRLGSARLLRNGEALETFDLTGETAAVRLDQELVRPEPGPAWYVLLVEGDAFPMAPVHGDTAFSITNPVFVDPE